MLKNLKNFTTRFQSWIRFNLFYLQKPPWDTGITPPEVYEFISNKPPGKVLDLGCGTGTNLITLARAGWDAWGIDFSPLAVASAQRKIFKARVKAKVDVGDVTRLDFLNPSFDLILDIGCFHGLPESQRKGYHGTIKRLLAPGGYFLIYAHLSPDLQGNYQPGLNRKARFSQDDFQQFITYVDLVKRVDSQDRFGRPAAWLTFHRAG